MNPPKFSVDTYRTEAPANEGLQVKSETRQSLNAAINLAKRRSVGHAVLLWHHDQDGTRTKFDVYVGGQNIGFDLFES